MSIIGTRVLRKEDPEFLTTGATYTSDLRDPLLDGAAHVTYVRSQMAHARITSVEVDEARDMPGVVAVHTAADVADLTPNPPTVPLFPEPMMRRPYLAGDVTRFVGEPIAVIVSETPEQGEDAAELVYADYEPLDAVVDLEAAAEDTVVVHPDVGTNTAVDFAVMGMVTGIEDDTFADCDVVVSQRIENQRLAACPMEPRAVAATWQDGRIIYWGSTQAPHGVRRALGTIYGLEPEQIRVVAPAVGGGFGAKGFTYPEEMLLPWLAQQHGRPMRWTETRSENMLALGHGRGQVQRVTIGGDRDGNVAAYRLEVIGDVGAYTMVGGFLPWFAHVMASGVYAIPKIETAARSVVTNTMSIAAYRGAGRPEATAAIERAMDLYAAEIGLDPAEIRRRNMIGADQFPFTTATGTEYDTGDYGKALDEALAAAGYDDLRAEQARRREAGDPRLLGIGLSVYVEVTAGPAPGGNEFAKVEITPDGKARVYSGASSHGQSHATTFAQVAADRLGMGIDDVELVQSDTDLVAQGVGTFGSRSLQLGGSAVSEAATEVVDKARAVAARLLEANVDDVVLDADSGTFHVAGTPSVARSWAEVAVASEDPLTVETDYSGGATYPFGAHVAVVEVDADTGQVTLQRVVSCDDSGPLVNPNVVEGQRHGGIAQGAAQALLEEVRFDEYGTPQTANFADYSVISATELPSFELVTTETPTDKNALGVKGIGESGTIGVTPAVQNAVVDALAHLGVRHVDMPCTAEKVWAAISAADGS